MSFPSTPISSKFDIGRGSYGCFTESSRNRPGAESLGIIPELQNYVASAGCRSHLLEKAYRPLDRLDYYAALGLTSCEGHPLERLDQRGFYPWHGIDTLPAEITVSALISVKDSLIDSLKQLKDWKQGDPCTSNWTGVFCYNTFGDDGYLHVRELRFMNKNLSGSLAPELGKLSQLRILNFMWNNLTGRIPKEIGSITDLRLLRLMRQDGMVEGALVASRKTQSRSKIFKNYPPCEHCGKMGHPPYKCWKRPDKKCIKCNQLSHEAVMCKNKFENHDSDAHVVNEEEEDHLFVATDISSKVSTNFWLIDSGCTNHMTYNKSLFKELKPTEISKVRIESGDQILVEGKGTVIIKISLGNKTISDVLYVPDIDKNLLSICQLIEKEYKVSFENKHCFINDGAGKEVLNIKMRGSLADELGYLSNLNRFQIDQNQISGEIPKSFSNLNRIRHIHFNNNSLSGQIPHELSNLSAILHLLLDNNNLSGYLPPEFSAFPDLEILQLDNNNFSGSEIPASYGNLSSLLKLSFRNCSLQGSIPDFSRIGNLSYLSLKMSTFCLLYSDLSWNQLSGSIPPNKLSNNMTTIILSHNRLNGSVPKSFSLLPSLQKLSAANNFLNGSISTNIWQNKTFTTTSRLVIDLQNNSISNISGAFEPPVNVTLRFQGNPICSDTSITNIEKYCGPDNGADDEPSNLTNPSDICPIQACPTDNYFEFVPALPELCFCASPLRIGYRLKSPSISYFDPYRQLFESYVTSSLDLDLYQLWVESYFWEKGPRLRMHLKLFPVVGVSTFNQSEILRISEIFASWDFPRSDLFGPYELLNFTLLGPYSYSLTDFVGMGVVDKEVDFGPNSTPKTISSREVVLDHIRRPNSPCPTDVELQQLLACPDCHNVIADIIPGNPYNVSIALFPLLDLYFSYDLRIAAVNPEIQHKKESKGVLIACIVAAGAFAAFVSTIATILITRRHAKYQSIFSRKRLSSSLSIKVDGVKSFTFREMASATNNFDTSTQVGEGGYGSVFRGILADKTIVAIKRAKEGSLQGQNEFLTEIELLSRLHHRNLVVLLGYCDEEGEQEEGTTEGLKKDEEEKQMQLWHRETNELMVLEGISPLAIQSDKLLESCNEKKKNMDGNNLDDNITQIAQDVDLSPMQMEDFNQCINLCNLDDPQFKGNKYIWWNGIIDEACIFKRLDGVLYNNRLQRLFQTLDVEHLPRSGSDCSPILIQFRTEREQIIRSFRFLNWWLKEESCLEVIKQNWTAEIEGNPFIVFQHKLKKTKTALSRWSKETFGNIFQEIATLEDIIKVKEKQFEENPSGVNRANLNKAQAKLNLQLKR
ncbi:putative LRR receptor-like serine/threonine-protein kinase [Capsicum annuum]|nr:putative LRR receptor-like serine/threonine-protein kinase [Capsicum annuum]KAF3636184.1 putative LRR receptor-like serine/threonine-protein kinase [Capsicum annuum]